MFGQQQLTAKKTGVQNELQLWDDADYRVQKDTEVKKLRVVSPSPAEVHQVYKGCEVLHLVRQQMSCGVRGRQHVG